MDPLIAAAARALAAGDPLDALNRVALRDDASALALRGIAMAQLGDLSRARLLVRRAARAFGAKDVVARARCVVAEAEIALASRDLAWPAAALDAARTTLEHHGDRVNGTHARTLIARRLLLIGHVDEAEQALTSPALLAPGAPAGLPPALTAVIELVAAGIAIRRGRAKHARAALGRAEHAARRAGIPALIAEIEGASHALDAPAARLIARGAERPMLHETRAQLLDERPFLCEERLLRLDEVEALLNSSALVVDARRFAVQQRGTQVSLATRPVLFTLVRTLAEAWPGDAPRGALIARAFRARIFDDSHRARLRVEIGRLRASLRAIADVRATSRGFVLVPRRGRGVVVLAPPAEDRHAGLLAHLADGQAWSTSALALALDASQRSVQRALESLASTRKVQALGHGRSRRWVVAPVPGFTTTLLLPTTLPGD